MTEQEDKVLEIIESYCESMTIYADQFEDIAKEIVQSLALPHVIDCDTSLVRDPTHGEFDIQLCGGCKNGPITNEVFCPVCGCKIGRRCL